MYKKAKKLATNMNGTCIWYKLTKVCGTNIKIVIRKYTEKIMPMFFLDSKDLVCVCIGVNFRLSFYDHRRHRIHLDPQQWVGDVGYCRPRLSTVLAKSYSQTFWAFWAHTIAHNHRQTDTYVGINVYIFSQRSATYAVKEYRAFVGCETNGKCWNE